MSDPTDASTTLTDDEIETRRLDTPLAHASVTTDTGDDSTDTGDDAGDTGDDAGDTGDTTDTADDAGDTTDTGDGGGAA